MSAPPDWFSRWPESADAFRTDEFTVSAASSVSLVMPSLNQAKFLEQAILSVVNQRYPSLEFIVLDGGSKDGSLEILEEYSEHFSFWESVPDRGQAHAINKGFRRAKGSYVWWLNADDMLTPSSLWKTVQKLESNPDLDLIYGDLLRIDQNGIFLGDYSYPDFEFNTFMRSYQDISQAGGLLRRSALERFGYLREDLQFIMDREFWMRISDHGGGVGHISSTVALFRIHQDAKTQSSSHVACEEHKRVTYWILEDANLSDELQPQRSQILAGMHLHCSRIEMKAGDYRAGISEWFAALRIRPVSTLNRTAWVSLSLNFIGLIIGRRALQGLRRGVRQRRNRPSTP